MNIQTLSNLNANVSVCVTLADLNEFVEEKIIKAAANAKQVESQEIFLTVHEVCEMLRVSHSTLWRWGKSGYLCPVKIGRTSMYRQNDVRDLLYNK